MSGSWWSSRRVAHAAQDGEPATAVAMALCATRPRDVVALAVRVHGVQRGWHAAAEALGIKARTARALANGETTGARIPEERIIAARISFARARARQLRDELAELERLDDQDLARGGACLDVVR